MSVAIKLPTNERVWDRSLPKGVYAYETKKGTRYWFRIWDDNSEFVPDVSKGGFKTPEEAAYRRRLAMYGHHWEAMPEDKEEIFGFVYIMEHRETGQLYIGSKQLHFWNGPVGGWKCTAPSEPEWDPRLWHESDWKEYVSSSKKVQALVGEEPWRFNYRVLHVAKNKLELHLLEIKEQVDRGVLVAEDAAGNYQYLNENIMGQEYRPPVPIRKLRESRENEMVKLMDYYLKPSVCSDCGLVIPYGDTTCPNKPMFGDGTCVTKG